MSDEPDRISYLKTFKAFTNRNIINKIQAKSLTSKGQGVINIIVSITAIGGFAQFIYKGYIGLSTKHREHAELKARRNMVGNDIANGLAWSHYFGYLQYVLPDIDKDIGKTKWFEKERERVSTKFYEVIPRKCYIDIEADVDIKKVEKITIEKNRCGNKREINVQIYSVRDGEMLYYCMFECPNVLNTINNANDIQSAGISKIGKSETPEWQLFTIDTKLVQLMRFYYAMTSLLCLQDSTKDKARLLLFNDREQKLSEVLLRAIKEDIGNKTKENKVVTFEKKLPRPSLMETKLLTKEENKDLVYEFDAFVAQTSFDMEEETISQALEQKKLKILSKKDCLGQDWLETLKFAATKCRWIVLLEKKQSLSTPDKSWFDKLLRYIWSENNPLMSFRDAASLKSILESRKVQTVAIVNERDKLFINDDLRWVTCIPYNDHDEQIVNTLFKVLSGLEVKLDKSRDLCLRPGEVAIGLAWGYVSYLNIVLPGIKEKKTEIMNENRNMKTFKEKLFIVVPKSGVTNERLKDVIHFKDTQCEKGATRSFQLSAYKLHKDKETYCFGQYAPPVEVIHKMKEQKLLTEAQMKSEVTTFCTTVEKIMKILLKEKEQTFEFVYYDDMKDNLAEVLSKRIE